MAAGKALAWIGNNVEFKMLKARYPRPKHSTKPATRVAVVTGANRGIGLAVVRGLCRHFDGDVILTSRGVNQGHKAVRMLKSEGLSPIYHNLELRSRKSITNLAEFLKETYGGMDVLVNNAARIYQVFDDATEFKIQAKETVEVNYFCTLEVCHVLFPLLRKNARVCNMSSLSCINTLDLVHPNIQKKLLMPSLTMQELSHIMDDYVGACEVGKKDSGFVMSPMGAYGISKVGVTVMTDIQQRAFDRMDENRLEEGKEQMDIVVNALSPGYVMTERTQFRGEYTPDQAAEQAIKLCLLPPNVTEPRGKFVRYYFMFSTQELPRYRQIIKTKREIPILKSPLPTAKSK